MMSKTCKVLKEKQKKGFKWICRSNKKKNYKKGTIIKKKRSRVRNTVNYLKTPTTTISTNLQKA